MDNKGDTLASKGNSKTRIKKCLMCFKNTASGTKNCSHCGFEFKSLHRKSWRNKLKDLVSRLAHG